MARQIIVGIDIGTSQIKVVIAEGVLANGRSTPVIIGAGSNESRGVKRGYITNQEEAAKSIKLAVSKAEKIAGVKVKRAYVSFGGIGLDSVTTTGTTVITRADSEITDRDISLALESAEKAIPQPNSVNRKIINRIPIEYKMDGEVVLGQAVGLKAEKLEVRALFITCLEHHLSTLISTVEMTGIEVIDVVASPVALSFVTLSKKQKRAGCLLVDIGAETTSIVVFEDSNLISLKVFPIGSDDITNDIALGLKISQEEAENVKLGLERGVIYQKKKLDDIIKSRLSDCFSLIEAHLKSIGRNALLPGGSIITGGGANVFDIKNIAENSLKLPSQIAEIHFGNIPEGKIKDNTWAIACGLAIVGFNNDDIENSFGIKNVTPLKESGERWAKNISKWFNQFLP